MLNYSDGKPLGDSPVMVYTCPKCRYVARLDNTAMIPNRCPRCRITEMNWVRGATVQEVVAHIGVSADEWEELRFSYRSQLVPTTP